MNDLKIHITTLVNKALSKRQIKNDLKDLENTPFILKVLAGLNKPVSKRRLKEDLKDLQNTNLDVKTMARLDKTKSRRQLQSDLKSLEGTSNINIKARVNARDLKRQLDSTDMEAKINVDEKGFKNKVSNIWSGIIKHFGAMTLLFGGVRIAKEGLSETLELDKSLTNLLKVSDDLDGRNSLPRYLQRCNEIAKNLSINTRDLIDSITEFKKIGFDLPDAENMAAITTMFANVADANIDTATKSMISALKAFNEIGTLGEGQFEGRSLAIADAINEVGNKYSVSSEGLMEALSNSSAALEMAGNDLYQTLAIIGTGNKILQDPSELGNALKTVSMRLRNTKGELEELGVESDGAVESITKLQTQILNLTKGKVNIMASPDEFKSTYDILLEIGKVWKDISDVDQASLLELIAGKHRGNAVGSLLKNIEEMPQIYETAVNSSGSAMEEYSKYMMSAEASITRFKQTAIGIWNTILSGEDIRKLADKGTGVLSLAEKLDLLKNALIGLSIYGGTKLFLGMFDGIRGAITNVSNLGKAMSILKGDIGTNAIAQLSNLTKGLNDNNLKLVLSSKALTHQQRLQILVNQNLTVSEAEAKLATMGLSNANLTATGTTITFKNALQGLWMVLKTNPLILIVTAITAVTSAFSYFNNQKRETIQKAQETADALSDEIETIDGYKIKILELRTALSDKNLSDEESYSIRKQLLEIQAQLIDSYGGELQGINLVNGALKDQINILDDLGKSKYEDFTRESAKGIAASKDFFETDTSKTMSTARLWDSDFSKQVELEVKKLNGKFTDALIGPEKDVTFFGDPKKVLSQYEEFFDAIKIISKNSTGETAKDAERFLTDVGESIRKQKEKIGKYEDTYKQYIEGMIKYDSEYSDSYAEILSKRANLEKQQQSENEESLKKAQQELFASMNEAIIASDGNESVVNYFKNMYPDLQSEFSKWKFELDFNANTDGLPQKLDDALGKLDGMDDLDIINIGSIEGTEEQEEAYQTLIGLANNYKMSIEDLISWLVEKKRIESAPEETVPTNIITHEPISLSDFLNGDDSSKQIDDAMKKIDRIKSLMSEVKKLSSTDMVTLSTEFKDVDFLKIDPSTEKGIDQLKDKLRQLIDQELTNLDTQMQDVSETEKNEFISALRESAKTVEDTTKAFAGLNKITLSDVMEEFKNFNSTMSTLDSAYASFKDKEKDLGKEDVLKLADPFKDLSSYEKFVNVATNTRSSAKSIQSAFNDLATEFVHTSGIMNGLTLENEKLYTQMLKAEGIQNAEEIVQSYIGGVKLATENNYDLVEASVEVANKLLNEASASDIAKKSFAGMVLQKQIMNGLTINTTNDVNALISLAKQAGATAEAMSTLASIKKAQFSLDSLPNTADSAKDADKIESFIKEQEAKIKALADKGKFVDYESTSYDGSDATKKEKKEKKKTEEFEKEYDNIQRKLQNIKNKIDNTLNNLTDYSSLGSQDKAYKNVVKLFNSQLKSINKGISYYDKEINKVKKSLSKSGKDTLEKVLNGDISITELKGKGKNATKFQKRLANKIDKAVTLTDKKNSLQSDKISATNSKKEYQVKQEELKIAKIDNQIAKLQTQKSKTQAKIDIKEAKGGSASVSDYKALIKSNDKEIAQNQNKIKLLEEQRKGLKKSSEAYKSITDQINSTEEAIKNCELNQIEWNKAIANIPLDKIRKQLEMLEALDAFTDSEMDLKIATGKKVTKEDLENEIAEKNNRISEKERELQIYDFNYKMRLNGEVTGTDEERRKIAEFLTSIGESAEDKDIIAKIEDINTKNADGWLTDIYNTKTDVNGLLTDIANLNKDISNLAIEEVDEEISRRQEAIESLKHYIDLKGDSVTEDDYKLLLDSVSSEKELWDKRKALLEEQRNNPEIQVDSEDYNRLTGEIENCNSQIRSCEKSQKEYNKAILEIPLKQLQKQTEEIQKQLDILNKTKEALDGANSAVISHLDDEIKRRQEIINEMQEATSEAERQLALQKAKYELDKAMNNKTNKVLRNGEWVYESDADAVRDAQQNLSKAEEDIAIAELQKQIDEIEKYKEYVQEQLGRFEKEKNEQYASGSYDENWKELTSNLDYGFADKIGGIYYDNAQKIDATNTNLEEISSKMDSIESTIKSFENMEITFDDARAAIRTTSGYAKGTRNATQGWHKVNEDGVELLRTNDGELIHMDGGESVFTKEQTDRLMDVANGGIGNPNIHVLTEEEKLSMFKNANIDVEKLKAAMGSFNPLQTAMQAKLDELNKSMVLPNIVNNNNSSNPINVEMGGVHVHGVNDVDQLYDQIAGRLCNTIAQRLPNAIKQEMYKR